MPQEQMNDREELKLRLRAFAEARDWEQFHSPKNLAMALIDEGKTKSWSRCAWIFPDQYILSVICG